MQAVKRNDQIKQPGLITPYRQRFLIELGWFSIFKCSLNRGWGCDQAGFLIKNKPANHPAGCEEHRLRVSCLCPSLWKMITLDMMSVARSPGCCVPGEGLTIRNNNKFNISVCQQWSWKSVKCLQALQSYKKPNKTQFVFITMATKYILSSFKYVMTQVWKTKQVWL